MSVYFSPNSFHPINDLMGLFYLQLNTIFLLHDKIEFGMLGPASLHISTFYNCVKIPFLSPVYSTQFVLTFIYVKISKLRKSLLRSNNQ